MTQAEKNKIFKALNEAYSAAKLATEDYLRKNPDNWFPCGFAWVHLDGRSPVVRVLKESFNERVRGHKAYPKGWDIWNPSDHPTQCMDAKVAGCEAFVRVMRGAGYECYTGSRWD